MEEFRNYLRKELVKRIEKNSAYSLRAFAKFLGTNHATLSTLLSGKRKMTLATVEKFSKALDLSPSECSMFKTESNSTASNYFLIQQDIFSSISEWYYDAILELSLIPKFSMTPESIATSIGISILQAENALETLIRLELLVLIKPGNYRLKSQNSINFLDPDFTSAAHKRYQKSVLEKSLAAIDAIDRKNRDHTSTTMAIDIEDLPKVKELIHKFRHDLNHYLQRPKRKPNEVYQLQVAFFPLTQNFERNKKRRSI